MAVGSSLKIPRGVMGTFPHPARASARFVTPQRIALDRAHGGQLITFSRLPAHENHTHTHTRERARPPGVFFSLLTDGESAAMLTQTLIKDHPRPYLKISKYDGLGV